MFVSNKHVSETSSLFVSVKINKASNFLHSTIRLHVSIWIELQVVTPRILISTVMRRFDAINSSDDGYHMQTREAKSPKLLRGKAALHEISDGLPTSPQL